MRFPFKTKQKLLSHVQCDPAILSGGNGPETLLEGSPGGLQIFWLNHWQIQTKFKKNNKKKNLKILKKKRKKNKRINNIKRSKNFILYQIHT